MMIANQSIKTLHKLAQQFRNESKPFFLAVGFHRPHLPFVVPDKYINLYPAEEVKLPVNPYAPQGMPEVAWSIFDELRTYVNVKYKYGFGSINTTLPNDLTLAMRRAYYAAVSYTDGLVGQVLEALEQEGLSDSTVVSFWGDHGWQLGEHGEWCKHTNFEVGILDSVIKWKHFRVTGHLCGEFTGHR